MKTVFLVTHGSYSDFRVLGAFTSLKKAVLAKKLWAADCIEQYEANAMPPRPKGMFLWNVEMDEHGNSEAREIISAESVLPAWEVDINGVPVFRMWARTESGAVKIANARRQWLLANNLWTTDWDKWCELESKTPWAGVVPTGPELNEKGKR